MPIYALLQSLPDKERKLVAAASAPNASVDVSESAPGVLAMFGLGLFGLVMRRRFGV